MLLFQLKYIICFFFKNNNNKSLSSVFLLWVVYGSVTVDLIKQFKDKVKNDETAMRSIIYEVKSFFIVKIAARLSNAQVWAVIRAHLLMSL